MAKRRMFLTEILESDQFLDLAPETQMLYVHLCMHADDEGFLGGCKSVVRLTGAKETDLAALEDAGFLLRFSSGVCVIRHWRAHNLVRADRFTPTRFSAERAQLFYDETKGYSLHAEPEGPPANMSAPPCPASAGGSAGICPASARIGKDRLGKDSSGKDSSGKDRFSPHKAEEEKERKINSASAKGAAPYSAASAAERDGNSVFVSADTS